MSENGFLVISVRQDASDEADAEQKLANIKRAVAPIAGLTLSATYASKLEDPVKDPDA